MVKFIDFKRKVLPYNREHYIEFLDDDFIPNNGWNALSFSIKSKANSLIQSLELLELFLKNAIIALDSGNNFIINHDDKDMKWFIYEENNLPSLRTLFKRNNIQNTFKGYLICKKNDLFDITNDIVSYPYILSYKNLDISHENLPFIIKITDHLTIDLLSTDKILLNEIKNKCFNDSFNIIEYRGSQSGIL